MTEIRCMPRRTRLSTVLLIALAFASQSVQARGLALNQPVPDFRAVDVAGAARTLADFKTRATLLLFWHPDNARSRAALCDVAKLAATHDSMALVSIVPGEAGRTSVEQAVKCSDRRAVLLDPERTIFGDYQVIALPTLMLIDSAHRLKFKIAGFATEGLGEIENQLNELEHRTTQSVSAPAGPPDAVHRLALAQQLLKLGLQAKAGAVLENLVKSHPAFAPGWTRLGYLHLAADRLIDAASCLEKASALGDRDAAAGLALIASKQGDAKQAGKWAAQVRPTDEHAYLIRGISPEQE